MVMNFKLFSIKSVNLTPQQIEILVNFILTFWVEKFIFVTTIVAHIQFVVSFLRNFHHLHTCIVSSKHQQMRNDTLKAAVFSPTRISYTQCMCMMLTELGEWIQYKMSLSLAEGKNSLNIHIVAHEFILRLVLIACYYSINNNRNQLLATFVSFLFNPFCAVCFSTVHVFSHVIEEDTRNIHNIIINDKREWVRFFEWEWSKILSLFSYNFAYNFICYCGQVTSKHQKLPFFTQFTFNFDNNLRLTTTTTFFLPRNKSGIFIAKSQHKLYNCEDQKMIKVKNWQFSWKILMKFAAPKTIICRKCPAINWVSHNIENKNRQKFSHMNILYHIPPSLKHSRSIHIRIQKTHNHKMFLPMM